MPKKKDIILKKKVTKKKTTVKKVSSVLSKTISQKVTKSKTKVPLNNPKDFLQVECENQLRSLIIKEFDKELAFKADNYIKSYSKIDESIITVNDFLNYIENLDEDLFKLFKAYSGSSENDDSSAGEEKEEDGKSSGVKSDDPFEESQPTSDRDPNEFNFYHELDEMRVTDPETALACWHKILHHVDELNDDQKGKLAEFESSDDVGTKIFKQYGVTDREIVELMDDFEHGQTTEEAFRSWADG